MSAYEDFAKERQAVDHLLQDGYRVVNIAEDLDGAKITFLQDSPERDVVELLLLTADARKHVTTAVLTGSNRTVPIETAV